MADALRDAATATVDQASDQAAKVGQTVTNQGSHALRGLSRFAYSSSYVFAYAIVYPALFVAYSLPQDNPVMHGLRDGGRAAKELGEVGTMTGARWRRNKTAKRLFSPFHEETG